MKLDRLFHVLVVMSSAPTLSACQSADDDREKRREQVDAGVEPLAPCFCDIETCCDRSLEQAEVVDGFECCWSTTCP